MASDGFEVVSAEETRAVFAPDLNGAQLWRKGLVCDFCHMDLQAQTLIVRWQSIDIHFMCLDCLRASGFPVSTPGQ